MAMLTMEQVMRELEGKDENGKRTLLTERDLREVRGRFKDYAFAYSKKAGGHTVCSGCGQELERKGEACNDLIRCPHCRKDVQLKEEWRGHKYLFEQMVVYIWKRSKRDRETILAKAIHAEKSFAYAENAPLRAVVEAVYQFSPKGARMYTKNYYGQDFTANRHSVTPAENKHGFHCEAMHAGFWLAAENTQIGEIADILHVRLMEGQRGMHPVFALTEAARKPYLQHVILQGQEELAREIVRGAFEVKKRTAKNMPELLGITEGQWYEAKKNKLSLDARWMRALEQIQNAGNMTITLKDAWTAVENNSEHARSRLERESEVLLRDCSAKIRRKAVRRAAYSTDLIEWLDYWQQLLSLHEDMTDTRLLLPRDLHGMHQRMTERIEAIKAQQKREMDAILLQEHEKRMKALREKYTFEACGLILRPYETEAEIVAEGTVLHICIGGYAERYMKGQTILCALRRAECPEEPWRAVEFSAMTGKLVQDRGAWNDRMMGASNFQNGVGGWLRRFWAAFEARQEKMSKTGRTAA